MTNKKSSFLIKFIILSTLVLAFILVLLGIIFNNYSSSKDNKELINIVQQLEISDEKINSVFQNSFFYQLRSKCSSNKKNARKLYKT